LAKPLIEKGVVTKDEFMQKLSDERAVYQAMLGKMRWVVIKKYQPVRPLIPVVNVPKCS
jgi:hypothetical protein